MGYWLGLDVGTTFSAAATARDGRVEIVSLGHHAAAIPSLLFLREDGTFLVGEAAGRRGLLEPGRLARHFKRRFGDSTPLLLGGTPWSADALMSQLLRHLVAAVVDQEGTRPDGVAVTHPANWGPFKTDLLRQALRAAELDAAMLLSEPEAAAMHYASTERVAPGEVIAIYDLGGGTFDAAVLRKSESGFSLLGEPEGIERFGGIDFDEAVLTHVTGFVGPALGQLDSADPAVLSAMARLRAECVDAKEALSADTDVSISVMLPSVQTEIRLTRGEFEAMIRPTLSETTAAMRRALRSAGVSSDDVKAVLLVGGSSRIPLVGQLVAAEIGRPIAVDVHPKHAVALGAALAAGGIQSRTRREPIAAPGAPRAEPAVPAVTTSVLPAASSAESDASTPLAAATGLLPAVGAPPRSSEGPTPRRPEVGGDSLGKRPRRSRRRAIVVASVIFAAITIVVVVVLIARPGAKSSQQQPTALVTGTTVPAGVGRSTSAAVTTTIAPAPGQLVFQDTFADPHSGWVPDTGQDGAGSASYAAGGYEVTALKPLPLLNTFSVASPYSTKFSSVAIEVDATIVSGVPADGAGVRCDYQGRAGLRYTFEVHRDGTWVMFRLGPPWNLALNQGSSPAIRTGTARNTILGQCTEGPGGTTKLVMTVNGVVLGSATDVHGQGPISWHGALVVYRASSSPGTQVRFTDFRTFSIQP